MKTIRCRNILIVDDDDDDAYLIKDTLLQIPDVNFEIDVAHTWEVGLTKLTTAQFDVVLCDFRLGGRTGIDFLEMLRVESIEVPLILLTGVAEKSVDQAALEAGASDFLAKDKLTANSLDRAIRYAVANHSRRQLLNTVINNANAAVLVTDENECPILWNASFADIAKRITTGSDECPVAHLQSKIFNRNGGDVSLADATYDVHSANLPDGGKLTALHDVSERVQALEERRRAERKISHLAMHDSLTGLPNRSAFNVRLAEEIERAKDRKSEFHLLTLDLDRFKEINDVFGHQMGDDLLVAMSDRLSRVLKSDEFLARLGGDEFVAIQRKTDSDGDTPTLAARIQKSLERPIALEGKVLMSEVSIGAAIFPRHGSAAETLLSNADAAMYRAKASLGTSVSLFDRSMDERLRKRRKLANDLKRTVAAGEIEVFFQPQASVFDRNIIGFEALARWHHPEYGYVPPDEFVPIAEDNGLIIEMGEHVLRKACEIASHWPQGYRLAVNVSPVQIKHSDLVSSVRDVLDSTGFSARHLELEITESVFIDDLKRTLGTLTSLKDIGVSVAMDDFGTGYSSLCSLTAFPFDSIKIDKSFVAKIGHCNQAEEILRSVLGLARNLGFDVVAEGVEDEAHVEFLRSERCQLMQGFLIGEPACHRSTESLLSKGHQDFGVRSLQRRLEEQFPADAA
ncbi:MAG: putative bifunctional diguanylate cyclase/phosphodiesterase [Hyphomicrobiaceae bacterium]